MDRGLGTLGSPHGAMGSMGLMGPPMGPLGPLGPSQARIGSSSTEARLPGWTQSLVGCHGLPWVLCHSKSGKKLLAKLEKEDELDAVAVREKPLK